MIRPAIKRLKEKLLKYPEKYVFDNDNLKFGPIAISPAYSTCFYHGGKETSILYTGITFLQYDKVYLNITEEERTFLNPVVIDIFNMYKARKDAEEKRIAELTWERLERDCDV